MPVGGCLDIFSLIYLFSLLSPSLWETARYRLKYCLKGPLNPKQPTNQIQCRGVLLICIRAERGPTTVAVGPGRGCFLIVFLSTIISVFFCLSRRRSDRLKYCLKRPKQQPTNLKQHGKRNLRLLENKQKR